jgi:hypothetical protein
MDRAQEPGIKAVPASPGRAEAQVDLIAGVLKQAGERGNNASSSRLLHTGKNERQKPAPKGSK